MSAPSYRDYWPLAAKRWSNLTLRPSQAAEILATAKKLCGGAYKPRYQAIANTTGVPWYVIAVLHERESGANFNRQLAQGDPLNRRSTNEPISGPFATFAASAEWALAHDHLNKVIDWRIEKILYWCEAWNGWGYWTNHPGTPSPYVWGGTSVQKSGKYIADHVWSSTAWDTQLGCAAMLYEMAKVDPSIKFVRETPEGIPVDAAPPVSPPTPNAARKPIPPPPTVVTTATKVSAPSRFWHWLTS